MADAIMHAPSSAHEPEQSLPEHPIEHGIVCIAGHAPMPSQTAAFIFVIPAQVCSRQLPTEYLHAVRFTPSHFPPQLEPSEPHAIRPLARCTSPVTGTQVPTELGTSHASHCPVQASLQHLPSTQWPLLHAALLAHVSPFTAPLVSGPATASITAASATSFAASSGASIAASGPLVPAPPPVLARPPAPPVVPPTPASTVP